MLSMGQRSNDAAMKDAKIKLREVECAKGMGQKASARYTYAAVMHVQIKLRTEVYVGGMEELDYAGAKDAQIKLRKEECALGTEERHYAELRDVQIKFRVEACATGMEQRYYDKGEEAFPERWPSSVSRNLRGLIDTCFIFALHSHLLHQ